VGRLSTVTPQMKCLETRILLQRNMA